MAIKLDSGVLQALANPREIKPAYNTQDMLSMVDSIMEPWRGGGKVSDREKFEFQKKKAQDENDDRDADRELERQRTEAATKRASTGALHVSNMAAHNDRIATLREGAQAYEEKWDAELLKWEKEKAGLNAAKDKAIFDVRSNGGWKQDEKELRIAEILRKYEKDTALINDREKNTKANIANLNAKTQKTIQDMEFDRIAEGRRAADWVREDQRGLGHLMYNVMDSFAFGDEVSAEAGLGVVLGGVSADRIQHIEYIESPDHSFFDRVAYWFDDGSRNKDGTVDWKRGSFSKADGVRREAIPGRIKELTVATQARLTAKNDRLRHGYRQENEEFAAKMSVWINQHSQGVELTSDERRNVRFLAEQLPGWDESYGRASVTKQEDFLVAAGLMAKHAQRRDPNLSFQKAARMAGQELLGGSRGTGWGPWRDAVTKPDATVPDTSADIKTPRPDGPRGDGLRPAEWEGMPTFEPPPVAPGGGGAVRIQVQRRNHYMNINYPKYFLDKIRGVAPSAELKAEHQKLFPTRKEFVDFLEKRNEQVRARERISQEQAERLLEIWGYPALKW